MTSRAVERADDATEERDSRDAPRAVGVRDLALVLALGVAGAAGLVPGASGECDPVAALAWVALIAPAAGYWAGASGLRPWPVAPAVPVLWLFVVALADSLSRRDLPAVAWCAPPVVGLFGVGFALGRWFPRGGARVAGGILLVTALLSALPLGGLVLRRPPPPRVAARLLDMSPVTLAVECAGVDWMRHPVIYDAASTVDIDPSMRTPYDGRLAGLVVFVVGCAAASIRGRSPARPAIT